MVLPDHGAHDAVAAPACVYVLECDCVIAPLFDCAVDFLVEQWECVEALLFAQAVVARIALVIKRPVDRLVADDGLWRRRWRHWRVMADVASSEDGRRKVVAWECGVAGRGEEYQNTSEDGEDGEGEVGGAHCD